MDTAKKQLRLLHELALMLERVPNGEDALNSALALLARHLGMLRGSVAVVDPEDGKIRISAAYGLREEEAQRGVYSPGEGIIGRVMATGRPMRIDDVSAEPLFLNRTGARDMQGEAVSFLCVPIMLGGEVVGALSADRPFADCADPDAEMRILRVIAAMLAPAAFEGRPIFAKSARLGEKPPGFVGGSERMRQVYAQMAQVAVSQATVFLRGESGTGKELVANAIHAASGRGGPFISLNCAALPENLIESELFGHERGAFTGASQMRKGRFELADGGTLFLDEIGELGFMAQAKLLRVLQEHAFERLGGMHTLRVDVRVIAATNRNLERMVEEGAFRRDLFYRLNVFPIFLPPLRERLEDVPALAAHFLRREAKNAGRGIPRISMAAMDLLQRYEWPGNIRELQNIIERAMLLLNSGKVVLPEHLPEYLRKAGASGSAAGLAGGVGCLGDRLRELERGEIESALAASRGHIGNAARALGMTERVLSLRLARYGLDYRHFRRAAAKKL